MALNTNKSISITGTSTVNGSVIMQFNANLATGKGSSNISQSIINQDLYDANKKEARADSAAFQSLVYDTEDQLDQEAAEADTNSADTTGK